MTDIVLRQQFAAAGTGAHTRTVGQSLAVQTTAGMTVTVQGSNVPEDASSWETIGTASGYTATPLTTPLAFLRVVADGAGIVSISAADGAAGGSGGGGGAGDASAANQTTQITAAATTNTRLGDVTETAPATDTASSGINGRLQRVAQRLTSLIALLPASLGAKAATASLSVVHSTLTRADLLAAVTATGAGAATADAGNPPSFTATVAGTGAVSATVQIRARNTASGQWVLLGTITLSGTTTASDGFAALTRYMEYQANVTAISGTGAAVTVSMGS
ncbi:MAG TPA: hypothetical protein PLQ85_09925 [Anaerolineae bacterium]|nr:hypothetical protein [Anaerolineae bacterium]